MSVDTLTLARELRAADFAGPQAEAIAAAIGRAVAETSATKADLAQLGSGVDGKLGGIDARLAAVDVRFTTLEQKIEQQGARLSAEIKAAVAASESTLIKWFIGAVFALGGLMVALTKL